MALPGESRPKRGRRCSPPGGVHNLPKTTDPLSVSPRNGSDVASEREGTKSRDDLFKAAARLLFGAAWQREAARALGRDETALARFLLGERTREDADRLYADMLALMRQRAAEIALAADRFAQALALTAAERETPTDQGI